MFDWLTKRGSLNETATEIYGAIVTRGRTVEFYRAGGAADTPSGRYEVIVLVMVLVLERLRQAGAETLELQRTVIEAFVTDMDDCMREMGVGDLTVPKKVKKAAAGLLERMEQYGQALASPGTEALEAALQTNVPGVAGIEGGAARLAAMVRADQDHLRSLSDAAVSSGAVSFSSP